VQFVSDEEVDTLYKQYESTDWENKDFLNAYPALHRDTGVGILEIVANSKDVVKTVDNSEFRNDTLFCEGIYEVDFSTNSFISIYADNKVSYDLDNLPSDEEYLAMWVSADSLIA
jgi:predicted SAM-dependent methyltransferase